MSQRPTSFLTHAAIYGLGTLLLQAASVVLIPLYAHCLTPAEFGVLEILTKTGEVLNVCLMANGIAMAAYTFYCQDNDPARKVRIAASVTVCTWAIMFVGMVFTDFAAPSVSRWININDSDLVAFGINTGLLAMMASMPMTFIQARVESKRYVVVSFAIFLTRIAFILIAVVVLKLGVWGILAATAAAFLLCGCILMQREFANVEFRPDWHIFSAMVRFALPFVPIGIAAFVLNNGDRFFLSRYCGKTELGLYAMGYKLAAAVQLVSITPLYKVWSSRMYDDFRLPDAARHVAQVFTRMLGAYLFVGMGLCLFDSEVLRVFGSASFEGAGEVIEPLVLAFFFTTASMLLDGPFYVYRCTHFKAWITLLSTGLILGLYWLLIPRYGSMGAAFAALIAFAVHTGLTLVLSQRVFRIHHEFGRIGIMLLLAIALVAPKYWLGCGVAAIAIKIGLFCAWPAALWIGGILTPYEKAAALERLNAAWTWIGTLSLRNDVKVDL